MQKFKQFKVGDIVTVSGKIGTNGPLEFAEMYEVIKLTDENSQESFNTYGYAIKPIIVLDKSNEEYRPFLGKLDR